VSVTVRRRKRASGKSILYVRIRVKLPDGRILREERAAPVQAARDAYSYGQQREAQLLSQRKPPPLFEDFAKDFYRHSKAQNEASTLAEKEMHLRVHLVPYFGRMYLDQIRPAEIQAFVTKLEAKGYGAKYTTNILTTLGRALNLAEELEVLDHAPTIHKPKAPAHRRPSLELSELDLFEQAARAWPERLAFLLTAAGTGLRSGELRALRWSDVDTKAGFLVCRRSRWKDVEKGTKNGEERKIPLTPALVTVLKAHRDLRSEYVFHSPAGKPLTASMVKDWVPDACARAGIARVTNHGLRHSFASALANTGSGRDMVRSLMGHKSDAMAAHYTRLSEGYTREAVDRLARWGRGGAEGAPEQPSDEKAR
jgi:integrase